MISSRDIYNTQSNHSIGTGMDLSARAIIFLIGFILACVFVIFPVRITPKKSKRNLFLDYSTVPILITVLLFVSTCLPWVVIVRGTLGKDSPAWAMDETSSSYLVPYTVIILFMSLAYVCTSADFTKCFIYIANKFSKLAMSSRNPNIVGLSLFTLLAAIFTLTTSNDIVVLTLTPIILEFSRKTDPRLLLSLLLAEFCSANSFSAGLLSGNPSNIILSSVFRIDFITYLKYLLIPAICSGCCVYVYCIILANKSGIKQSSNTSNHEVELIVVPPKNTLEQTSNLHSVLVSNEVHGDKKEEVVISHTEKKEVIPCPEKDEQIVLSLNGILALGILLLLFCLFLLSTAIQNRWPVVQFWHIAVFVLLITLIKDFIVYREKPSTIWMIIKSLPWKVPLFLLSMFILVEGASYYNITTSIANGFAKVIVTPVVNMGDFAVAIVFDLLTCIACIIFNNLPATIFITRIISEQPVKDALGDKLILATFSTSAGTNFGACILPHASLAGLMWSSLVKDSTVLKKVWVHGSIICLLLVIMCSLMLTFMSLILSFVC